MSKEHQRGIGRACHSQKLIAPQYEWTIPNCLKPKLGCPQKIEIRDRITINFIEKHYGKLSQKSKGTLQVNGTAAISKICNYSKGSTGQKSLGTLP